MSINLNSTDKKTTCILGALSGISIITAVGCFATAAFTQTHEVITPVVIITGLLSTSFGTQCGIKIYDNRLLEKSAFDRAKAEEASMKYLKKTLSPEGYQRLTQMETGANSQPSPLDNVA